MTGALPERIRRRRAQMLVHSYLYYERDTSIVPDATFDAWARELAQLQALYDAPIGFYDEAFADWDGSTGYRLPRDTWVASTALRLQQQAEHDRRRLLDLF